MRQFTTTCITSSSPLLRKRVRSFSHFPLSNRASCLSFPAIDHQTIHTTIPIHEVSHDAPIIHQSQTHNAVPIEHFLQKGGILHNAISTNDIGSRVLHSGKCTREIDGTADELAKELKLTNSHVRILLLVP